MEDKMERAKDLGDEPDEIPEVPPELLARLNRLVNLTAKKKALDAQAEELKVQIDELKEQLPDEMMNADFPEYYHGGYRVKFTNKTYYSKKSDAELFKAGIDYYDTLRGEGFGDLIKQRVDQRSLNAAVRSYVEENGKLSDGLSSIIREYEDTELECKPYTRHRKNSR